MDLIVMAPGLFKKTQITDTTKLQDVIKELELNPSLQWQANGSVIDESKTLKEQHITRITGAAGAKGATQ
jgi:hypothetical protein